MVSYLDNNNQNFQHSVQKSKICVIFSKNVFLSNYSISKLFIYLFIITPYGI